MMPLESYLMKLLAPEGADDKVVDETPATKEEEHSNEPPKGPSPALTGREPRGAEAPEGAKGPPDTKERVWGPKPFWRQSTEQSAAGTPAAVSVPNESVKSSAPKSRPKPAIRSLPPRERSSSGRQKVMIGLVPVLAILMVFVLKYPLGARVTAVGASEPQNETIPAEVTDIQIAWQIPAAYEDSGRDPMRTAPAPTVAVEGAGTTDQPVGPPMDLVVTGILQSEDRPAAIVDTQVVHEGQQISGATVEKIEKDGVQFERNGRRWKQALNQ